MTNLEKLHDIAMYIADLADVAKRENKKRKSLNLYKKAFKLEKKVAILALRMSIGEPSVSILLESAKNLALECKLVNEYKDLEKIQAKLNR